MGAGNQSRSSHWEDFFETDESPAFDEALRLVQQGEYVSLQGFGGTGRTSEAKDIARQVGKCVTPHFTHLSRGVITTAYTHAAAQTIAVEGCQ